MNEASTSERYLVPGLVRGIGILRMFSAERPVISTPQMARELGIPRSSIFRIVQTLEHLNLLTREKGGSGYRLAVGLLSLGFEYIASLDVTEIGRAELENLRDETGYSAHMVVRDQREVVVVIKAVGHSAFLGSLNVGARLPAHGTVLGRATLCDLEEREVRELFGDEPLPAYSGQTPRSVEQLLTLLAQDRTRGYALSNSFFESGISSVAAPVRDHTGRVVAAINVTVAGNRDVDDATVRAVCRRAEAISRALDYRPASAAEAGV